MTRTPKPSPSFLDDQKKYAVIGGRQVWVSQDGNWYYTYDGLHGEIEVFNRRGRHLGVLHAVTGAFIKPAVRGRKLDV